MRDQRTFIQKADDAWQNATPDWVREIANTCDQTNQSAVAKRLGVSGAMISNVLRNCYPGDMAKIEDKTRAVLMAETVICPVMGEISRKRCLDEQSKNHRGTSALRTRLYHACRNGCTNSRFGG
jgi:hypothetical protein